MALDFDLACSRCQAARGPEGTPGVCAACGAPLRVRHPLRAGALERDDLARRPWTMWRYRELLPVGPEEEPITLGEGGTPMLSVPALARRLELETLWVKDESVNPTGSFKARGMAAAVTRAAAANASGLVVASAGNAAVALAAYGARAGLVVRVYLPRATPQAMVRECRGYGADVVLVDGLITDCGARAREWAAQTGHLDLSTLREPYRVEGKKSMAFEICEQLGWTTPDAVLYPTGGGTGLIGMWKAFRELEESGWIAKGDRPRMYAVQAAGCAPIVRAWRSGAESAKAWSHAETAAAGLRVPYALGDFLILRALRESDGAAVAVTDAELLRAARELRDLGIGAGPEGGAAFAGLRRLRAAGAIGSTDRVVCFNTGSRR